MLRAYQEYEPLFTAMRGARWWLSPNPVHIVSDSSASVNAFRNVKDGSLLIPIMLAAPGTSTITLEVSTPPEMQTQEDTFSFEVLYPGASNQFKPLGDLKLKSGAVNVSFPLPQQGCAMLRATRVSDAGMPAVSTTSLFIGGKGPGETSVWLTPNTTKPPVRSALYLNLMWEGV